MKIVFLPFVAGSLLADEGPSPKPTDAVVAAYFKAATAEAASKAAHETLMENIKKAIADSIARQMNANIQAVIASSQLNAACGEYVIDQEALKNAEVRCIPRPK